MKITTLLNKKKSDISSHTTPPDASKNATAKEEADQPTSPDTQHGIKYSFIYYVANYSTTLM